MGYDNLKIGEIIKFNSWNDDVIVGVIKDKKLDTYTVQVNDRIWQIFVQPEDVIEIILNLKP